MPDLKPGTTPFSGTNPDITIYVVTGVHGLFKIPERFCKECHLFVDAAEDACEDIDTDLDIEVRSYWARFLYPMLKGGFHPPVMMIDGEIIAQGYNVPDKNEIVQKL